MDKLEEVIQCCVYASNSVTGQPLLGQEVLWHEFDCAWSSSRPNIRNAAPGVQLPPPVIWDRADVNSATVPTDPTDLPHCYRRAQRFQKVIEQAIIHRRCLESLPAQSRNLIHALYK